MTIRTGVIICVVAFGMWLFMFSGIFSSGFDGFAKSLTSDPGPSDQPAATEPVMAYLEQNGIDDPVAFFSENMKVRTGPVTIDDPSTQPELKEEMTQLGATAATVYTKRLGNGFASHHELRIQVFEIADRAPEIRAFIFFHSM